MCYVFHEKMPMSSQWVEPLQEGKITLFQDMAVSAQLF